MKGTAIIFLGALSLGGAQNPTAEPTPGGLDDEGTFVLSLAGHNYGTETFRIRSVQGTIEAEAEVQLREQETGHANPIESFPKLVLDMDLNPMTYMWSLKGSTPYNLLVDFTGKLVRSQLHLPGDKEDIREFQLPKDVVVLDNNVICHYQLLVYRYARTSGGKQPFQAYIPQDATPGMLTLQDAGLETVDLRGQKKELQHLVMVADNAEVDLWVDAQHRLQRLLVATSKLEVVRQK